MRTIVVALVALVALAAGCIATTPPAQLDAAALARASPRGQAELAAAQAAVERADATVAEARKRLAAAERSLAEATSAAGLAAPRTSAVAAARRDYAARVVEERRAELAEAEAGRRLAAADRELVRGDVAQREGLAAVPAERILVERQDAKRALAAARTRTGRAAAAAALAGDTWRARQRQEAARTPPR